MRVFGRPIALMMVCSLALLCTACSSKNKGKIEGKWKLQSAPGLDENMLKTLDKEGMYLYVEFKPDGTMSMGATSDDPEKEKALAALGQKTTMSWKYRLLSGETVEFYDLPKELQEKGGGLFGKNKDKARTKISISGDNMTMTDDDGKTGRMTRVKK